ncbi:MAG: Maf family protein [Planctomycetota bacterium]
MIYLASQSPQRSDLLRSAGLAFTVIASDGDEDTIAATDPLTTALERARHKALGAVHSDINWQASDWILAADTVVALDDEIFGKPRDDDDARRILGRLAGSTHSVITGHYGWRPAVDGGSERQTGFLAIARITMRSMSDDEITSYISTGECRERAGAYAIQESGDRFVVERSGEFDTVVGLNISTVRRFQRELTNCAPEALT